MIPIKLSEKDIARFWEKVDCRDRNSCWEWKASRDADWGYGHFTIKRKTVLAHRVAWSIAHNRPAPEHLLICHSCDNPPCCNPSHLFLGNDLDNSRDKHAKGRAKMASGNTHGRYTKPERTARGERNGRAKITDAQAAQLREMRSQGLGLKIISSLFYLSISQVSKIARGEARKDEPSQQS